MSLFCWRHRRALSLAAVLQTKIEDDPALNTHIAQCEECRAYWSELCSVTGALMYASAPKASPEFIGNLHAKLNPAPRREAGWQRALIPALAVSSLALGMIVWRIVASPSQPGKITIVDSPPKHINEQSQAIPATAILKHAGDTPRLPKSLHRRMFVEHRHSDAGHLHFVKANPRDDEPLAPTAASPIEALRVG